MRIKTLIAALRSLAKWFWLGGRRPESPAGPAASIPSPEPSKATPDGADPGPQRVPARDSSGEVPGARNRPSDERSAGGALGDDRRSSRSSSISAAPPSDLASAKPSDPSLSDFGETNRLAPSSAEADRPPTSTPPTCDDKQHPPPKTDEHPQDIKSPRSTEDRTNAGHAQETKREPHRVSGRRGRKPGKPKSELGQQPPSSRPELVCRKISASATWEVILSTDEHWPVAAVRLDDKLLGITERQCRIPSLKGRLTISSQDGRECVIPLSENNPFIFKLRENWTGEGRRVAGITKGHFIVIAPDTWQRTGCVPIEPDGCNDPTFRAHYFHRDATVSDGDAKGFREWSGSLSATCIELTGESVFDDSDGGKLFVGSPPGLKPSPDIEWARVGEEAENGWGQNFRPDRQSLPEVLDGREGRFFLRVYNSDASMLDSVAFRYLRNLKRIDVNGAEYAQDMVLTPSPKGYPLTEVRFIGAGGEMLSPRLPPQASQTCALSGAIKVPPRPDADCVLCRLESAAHDADIVINLPRIWWRLESGQSNPGEWCDTSLVMTREEFRNHAYSEARMLLLSKRFESVRAGFDDEPGQPYKRTKNENRIAIPLADFVDYVQIDQRLSDDACFNVELAGEIVSVVVISADPMPEIVSFTAEPPTVLGGQEATLRWTTANADDARVAITPDMGVVDSDGACIVRPSETTLYELTLTISGADDISRTVTVIVDSPREPDELPIARVKSSEGRWRSGKGFSVGELRDAGLTVAEAADRSIPIDRRRRSSHPANVGAIRGVIDA